MYDCPKCGAYDSTKCDFPINWRGDIKVSRQDEARSVGCRVMYYVDRAKTGKLPWEEDNA